MRFRYGKQDFRNAERAQESCWLLTNGLGGFSSQTIAGGASRNDHAVLMACTQAPNHRWNLVHRLEETLTVENEQRHLSSQQFRGRDAEEGWKHLCSAEVDGLPRWLWQTGGVQVEKQLALHWQHNTLAVRYRIDNQSNDRCTLTVTPWMQFVPKGENLRPSQRFVLRDGAVESAGLRMYVRTNGALREMPAEHRILWYAYDVCDGRRATGRTAANHRISMAVAPGETKTLDILFSLEADAPSVGAVLRGEEKRLRRLARQSGFKDPVAQQLAVSADAFVARRDSTGGKTILAGYPFFEDWGRDTMIALPGCTLATGRYDDARSILTTFLEHERDGLMPNLFPEGGNEPMYNTVDAALLFINCVWLYRCYTGDEEFVQKAWPVMKRIVQRYREGTRFGIHMDADGLIAAGQGLDQVTWMDVRIGEILPTPRHGKPVEINAYWYNALRILEQLAPAMGEDGGEYAALADRVRESFVRAFWREDKGCLKDLVSGTEADFQIRCNQIWAVSMPFTMLSPEQEQQVVRTVLCHLYTPVGLRTLSPEDPEFHPVYGGAQQQRDLAYHQGTVWPFPLGAWHLAYLKVNGYSAEAKRQTRLRLAALEPALREGCAGQLPEIYDGENPTASRGCFAQAWSVGELLRVYEALERPLRDE